MQTILQILLTVLLTILGTLTAASLWFAKKALTPRKFTYEKSWLIEVENGRFNEDAYREWDKQGVTIRSPYGYTLAGTWFPISGSRKTVVMVHGFPYTRAGLIKYIPFFRSRGFNVLIYDQRFFGDSGGPNSTYGFFEKFDLKAAVDWVLEQVGSGSLVGTLGESMGGATVLQHGVIDARPAFIICDSSYADLFEAMKIRLRSDFHLPAFPLLYTARWLVQLRGGFTFDQVSPLQAAAELQTPVLFVQGLNDVEVPPSHGRRLYAAKIHGLRRLYLAPDAGHVEAAWRDRDAYDRELTEFLGSL